MEQLVELAGIDSRDRLLARDQALVDHVDRGLQCGGGGALRASGLEEVELAVLDRELDVLHVLVVLLEAPDRLDQLVEGAGQLLLHRRHRLGRPDPGDDVLPLGVGEELAVEAGFAGRGVARERHARPRLAALVAEDHLDDVDGGAEVVRDVVVAAVRLCSGGVPRFEDGPDRATELFLGVLRERPSRLLLVDRLVGLDQARQVVFLLPERIVEAVRVDVVDDLAVHLDQPAVRVEREALVARAAGETRDGLVVQADVQDRVHHPRHRDGGAGADGDEQRVVGVAEALSGRLFEAGEVLVDLRFEALGKLTAGGHVGAAGVRRDREAGRNRDAELRHLGEADPLAAEEVATALRRLVEVIDVPRHGVEDCSALTAILPRDG